MVKSQFVSLRHGQVGQRGPRKSENEARLLLTGLPRGSFGLELSQPFQEDWVTANEVSDTLVTLSIERKLKNLIRFNASRYDFLKRFEKMVDEYNKGSVRIEIEQMLDAGLPEACTTDLFEQKCGALFQHMLEKYPEPDASVYGGGAA